VNEENGRPVPEGSTISGRTTSTPAACRERIRSRRIRGEGKIVECWENSLRRDASPIGEGTLSLLRQRRAIRKNRVSSRACMGITQGEEGPVLSLAAHNSYCRIPSTGRLSIAASIACHGSHPHSRFSGFYKGRDDPSIGKIKRPPRRWPFQVGGTGERFKGGNLECGPALILSGRSPLAPHGEQTIIADPQDLGQLLNTTK